MKRYTISNKGIAFEQFDDETIIVNLPIGHYYSLRGTANFIFNNLKEGACLTEIVNEINSHYNIENQEINKSVEKFIGELNDFQLLVFSDTSTFIPMQSNGLKKIFKEPEIEIFDDMQELLMLDPVHDVDSINGWPLKK